MMQWGISYFGILPSVAQPPFPLQEFLPLQPLSPDLQPPWPLQAFMPLQAWTPLSSKVCKEVPAEVLLTLAAWARTAKEPVRRPAMAALARSVFDGGIILFWFFFFGFWFPTNFPTA